MGTLKYCRKLASVALVSLIVIESAAKLTVQASDIDDAAVNVRFNQLARELRCLVCQNQSLADSNAVLAMDLKREIRQMLHDGASDEQVIRFLVDRYGDFVLYRPPVKASTLLLWFGPLLFLVIALWVLARNVGTTTDTRDARSLTESDRRRAGNLLRGNTTSASNSERVER